MATKNLTYDKIDITGGFWQEKQTLIRETTIWNVYKRFSDTGRFEAFKLDWKEGMPNKPHYFWDSDVAKWLESVAYLTKKKREPELEKIVDEVVDDIERGRMRTDTSTSISSFSSRRTDSPTAGVTSFTAPDTLSRRRSRMTRRRGSGSSSTSWRTTRGI